MFVHFGSLVHYELTGSTYGIYRDPSDTKHDVSQTVKQKSVLMNTSEILTNKDIQWQYPKTFEPSVVVDDGSLNELSYIQKVWVTCLSDPCCWYFHLPAVVAVVHVRPPDSRLQFDDTFAPATFGAAEHAVKKPNTKLGMWVGWLQRFSRHYQIHDWSIPVHLENDICWDRFFKASTEKCLTA